MPNLVRLRSPDADFGFCGIDAIPGPFPPLFPNDSKPASIRRKRLWGLDCIASIFEWLNSAKIQSVGVLVQCIAKLNG